MKMIEQMAWVMYEAERERVVAGTMRQWDHVSLSVKHIWMNRAADALSALEQPSEAMVEAGHTGSIVSRPSRRVVDTFTAMIRAAKEE